MRNSHLSLHSYILFFFFNDTATTEIYTLSLHDALPISDAVMSLKGQPNVVDIRTVGLTAGIDLAPRPEQPGKRGFDSLNSAFHDNDLMLRVAGDTLALTPPLSQGPRNLGALRAT